MRPGNYFFYCVGISLSWVAFIMSNLFISLGISSEVAHVKKKAAPLLTIDIIFLIIEILGCLLYLKVAFPTRSEMFEISKMYC